MVKDLKPTSSYFLSQVFWRVLRKVLNKKLWTFFYRLSQKIKMRNLILDFSKNDFKLVENLDYPQFSNTINDDQKFSHYLNLFKSSKPLGEYRNFLDTIFKDIKDNVRTILELGVSEGAGINALKKYFYKSLIWGIDIDKDTFFEDERVVKFDVADQLKIKTLQLSAKKFNTKFDLIIDDGWHHPESQVNSLIAFLPYLNRGGLYIVEDIVHDQYFKYFSQIIDYLKKKEFSITYRNFQIKGSDISNNLGYLFIRRN